MGDKIRTLSDAMLLGSTFRPQSFTDIYHLGRTCALGAAAEAIGIDVANPLTFAVQELLEERFFADKTTTSPVSCPIKECGAEYWLHSDVVIHLNDEHRWSRECIAAWLKTKGL